MKDVCKCQICTVPASEKLMHTVHIPVGAYSYMYGTHKCNVATLYTLPVKYRYTCCEYGWISQRSAVGFTYRNTKGLGRLLLIMHICICIGYV